MSCARDPFNATDGVHRVSRSLTDVFLELPVGEAVHPHTCATLDLQKQRQGLLQGLGDAALRRGLADAQQRAHMRRDDLQGFDAHLSHLIKYVEINIFPPSSSISSNLYLKC